MTISLIIPAYFANSDLQNMTAECIKTIHEDIQIILIANHAPYTVNVNDGLRAATGDVLIIGNNDLTFVDGWVEGLLKVLDAGYDIATCWTSDQNDIKLEDRISEGEKFGSLFAMKAHVYDTIGGFDEQFKGYFSDLDYLQRAKGAGFRFGKNLNLVVGHKAKATYAATDPDDTEYHRSMRLFEAKWGFIE